MTDEEFLSAFADTTLEPFHHADHLRLTLLQVRRQGAAAALPEIRSGLIAYASARDARRKYHETLTRFWVLATAAAAERDPAADVEALLVSHPALLDKDLPLRHWSRDLLFGEAARAAWVEPDLLPLPVPIPQAWR